MVAFRTACVALVLGLSLSAGALWAQEEVPARGIDKYLPADTEIISTLNFKQIFESTVFKKNALGPARDALANFAEVKNILDDLAFDPFLDLDKMITASPGGTETDKGLIILHGRFNLDKFKAKGEEAAKANGDILKIHKIEGGKDGPFLVYEVTAEGLPTSLFVALASRTTLLASSGKDYVIDAMKRKDKPALKNKDFQGMVEKMDPRQSFSIAAVGSALAKADLPEPVKEAIESLDGLGGGITIGDDVHIELVANAKTAQAAKDVNDKISLGLNQGLALLALLATQQKDLAPIVDVVKTIKTSARDKTITLKGTITSELIEKAIKKD
jgi:hypothetical protein